jgi:hypothetical protein
MPKVKKEEKLIVSTFARSENLKYLVDENLLIENRKLRSQGIGNLSLTALVCSLLRIWARDLKLREAVKSDVLDFKKPNKKELFKES